MPSLQSTLTESFLEILQGNEKDLNILGSCPLMRLFMASSLVRSSVAVGFTTGDEIRVVGCILVSGNNWLQRLIVSAFDPRKQIFNPTYLTTV